MQNKRSVVKQMECNSIPLGWNKFPQQKLRLNVTLFSPLVISPLSSLEFDDQRFLKLTETPSTMGSQLQQG
jgi:hypothetical protein